MGRYAAEAAVAGSPLSTLYSLFAGSGAAVLHPSPHPSPHPSAMGAATPSVTPLAARWAENLAVMLANPTTDDTEVIAQLGDALWGRRATDSAQYQ